jgi:septal ring factor EnvC (AmiA/AmiB activator)
LKEELKPLFDSYIKKYGKEPVPVKVPNWQQKFEKLQIDQKEKGKKYEFLMEKYNQSKQELQAIKAQLKSGTKANTSQNKSIDKVSSELLKNYEKLKEIDGDIVLELQDGKTLKAHRAVLIGEFLKLF